MPFGHVLRAKRLAKKLGLRKFAELVGVSPTYLSQVEQCNVPPPTTDRIERIAELLEENADEWVVLAGRIPENAAATISEQPVAILELLRTIRGLSPDQIGKLCKEAQHMQKKRV